MQDQLDLPLKVSEPKLKQLWSPDDIYDNLNAKLVLLFAEDRRVERKSARVQSRALGVCLSMWSNTQPHGGLIFVGLEDDGKITGCKSMHQKHKNKIESLLEFCPDARYSSKVVAVTNHNGEDDYVIAFRVEYRPDKLVETSDGEAYMREGSECINIPAALRREIQIAKGEIHYELESVALTFPDDFDAEEVTKFCRMYSSNRGFKQPKSTEELLELAKLGKHLKGIFKPNLACCLLLAKDPRSVVPGARIRLIRYEGTMEKLGGEQNSIFSEFIDGPVPHLLDLAKEKIASQMRSYQKLGANGRFERRSEYPEEAWFEAVVNAVAHRSYNFKNQNIFVKIFDDRLVVESPGGFVAPTTSATVYDAHNPRNPYLMEAMMHLELTFCGFEGTRRMRQAMISAQLPEPKFIQVNADNLKISVVLRNDYEKQASLATVISAVSEEVYENLSNEERSIVRYLSTNAFITVKIAASMTQRSAPTADKTLNSLVTQGILEPVMKDGRLVKLPKQFSMKEK